MRKAILFAVLGILALGAGAILLIFAGSRPASTPTAAVERGPDLQPAPPEAPAPAPASPTPTPIEQPPSTAWPAPSHAAMPAEASAPTASGAQGTPAYTGPGVMRRRGGTRPPAQRVEPSSPSR